MGVILVLTNHKQQGSRLGGKCLVSIDSKSIQKISSGSCRLENKFNIESYRTRHDDGYYVRWKKSNKNNKEDAVVSHGEYAPLRERKS